MKGMAIQTVLFLLVGILAVGLLAFLTYRYIPRSRISEQECREMATLWCTLCSNFMWTCNAKCSCGIDWDCDNEMKCVACAATRGPRPSAELIECAETYYQRNFTYPVCSPHQDFCRRFIPV